jgi:hypothetical protein
MTEEVNKGGRPAVVFDEVMTRQYEELASVLTKAQCADFFGISLTTLKEVEKRQPEVYDSYKKGKSQAIANVANNLVKQAKDGNMSAAIFYLKTQAGWSETQKLDVSGDFPTQIVLKGVTTDASRDRDTE